MGFCEDQGAGVTTLRKVEAGLREDGLFIRDPRYCLPISNLMLKIST
jgi:hypothetical protein